MLSTSAIPILLPLDRTYPDTLVGAKAQRLGQLVEAGYKVPRGFVLPTPAILSLRDTNPGLCRVASGPPPSAGGKNPEPLRLPTSLLASLERALQFLAAPRVILRSSALGEDGAGVSFAGQLLSVQCEPTVQAVSEALRAALEALSSEHLWTYCRARKKDLHGLALILQEYLQADVAGVLFTVDPRAISTSKDMLLEGTLGSCQGVVEGSIDPLRYRYRRERRQWVPLGGLGKPLPEEHELPLEQLAALGLELEQRFGAPQDLEWLVDAAGTLYLLQARPITTLPGANRVCWTNVNLKENYPHPLSPMLYSIALEAYEWYFRNLAVSFGLSEQRRACLEPFLTAVVGAHQGRLYYNLSNIHAILHCAPYGSRLCSYFTSFVGARGAEALPRGEAPAKRLSLSEMLTAMYKLGSALVRFPSWLTKTEAIIAAYAGEVLAVTSPNRPAPCDANLLKLYNQFLRLRFHEWRKPALADAAAMIFYGLLKGFLASRFPDQAKESEVNRLLLGVGELVSLEPSEALWVLAEKLRSVPELSAACLEDAGTFLTLLETRPEAKDLAAEFQRYLATWGFRGSEELMLTTPSFSERPELVAGLLRTYLQTKPTRPSIRMFELAERRRSYTEDVRRALMKEGGLLGRAERWVFALLHRGAMAAIRWRERARTAQARLYHSFRQVLLALGRQQVLLGSLRAPNDLFWLSYREARALLEGTAQFPELVQETVRERQRQASSWAEREPPELFWLEQGATLPATTPAGDPIDPSDEAAEAEGRVLLGIGASAGLARGRAKVVRDLREAMTLEPGDILVTRQTDPGWTTLFPVLAGLVIEHGGMLSHGAIVAREFGIPAVVGAAGCFARIPPGSIVEVDGGRGMVRW
ncbi:MAG: hypothetical protein A2284_09245 [Deltaproteobacteria bacterium RIFOXYA12_FULL_61_11]|nr:MAG: hypothetical protein A2284_09245 [Deltaproteobacteria bacterium RIFOXYA12_FULL_61_11]